MASTVSVQEGIRYGFGLLGYLLGVGGIGGITLLVGFGLFRSGGILAALGGLLVIAGVVVVYAGFLGIAYKVIADGVKVGVEAAE
jgi:hypothetical protein